MALNLRQLTLEQKQLICSLGLNHKNTALLNRQKLFANKLAKRYERGEKIVLDEQAAKKYQKMAADAAAITAINSEVQISQNNEPLNVRLKRIWQAYTTWENYKKFILDTWEVYKDFLLLLSLFTSWRLAFIRAIRVPEKIQKHNLVPSWFKTSLAWLGLSYFFELIADLAIVVYFTFFKEWKEKSWQKKLMLLFLYGERPMRMLNALVWFVINGICILLPYIIQASAAMLSVGILNVIGFAIDVGVEIYKGCRDFYAYWQLLYKVGKAQEIAGADQQDDYELTKKLIKSKLKEIVVTAGYKVVCTAIICVGMAFLFFFPPTSTLALAGAIAALLAGSIFFGIGKRLYSTYLHETLVWACTGLANISQKLGEKLWDVARSMFSKKEVETIFSPQQSDQSDDSPTVSPLTSPVSSVSNFSVFILTTASSSEKNNELPTITRFHRRRRSQTENSEEIKKSVKNLHLPLVDSFGKDNKLLTSTSSHCRRPSQTKNSEGAQEPVKKLASFP